MPEGDTIYRTARALEKALGGRVVTGFETGFAKLASANDDSPLVGRVVERVEARGKWCLIYFSGDLILLSHMLMSGSWHIYRTGERWKMPRRAMRVVVQVGPLGLKPLSSSGVSDGGAEVPPQQNGGGQASCEPTSENPDVGHPDSRYRDQSFQAVLFNAQVAEFHTARSLERSSQVPKLGPDVLAEGFTLEKGVAAMRERMRTHPADEVAVVLLNQRVMAGLGNVYKSEVAFAAGVNPFRAMSTLSAGEIEKMVEHSLKYMKANVGDGQRGEAGEGIVTYTGPRRTTRAMDRSDRTWVYGRQGQECRRCGTAIMRRLQGVAARPTYWCPVCQPWAAAEGQSGAAPVGNTTVVGRKRIGC
ncbi:Fpg/Nei family DNA glycosylase [Granulicella paludicola]|uniref:Fpg/Nei family DNA glycosylase n=1 Tax=Granulicella paludicola TaxID=474951 RepID=UPI0021DF87F6|nr:DNA-formamidopyrimidine glycosylase family protein [Granulicella paludicola]